MCNRPDVIYTMFSERRPDQANSDVLKGVEAPDLLMVGEDNQVIAFN